MASIIREIVVDAAPAAVWDAVADFGAVHRRFAPGFVTDVELVEGARMVTFGDGMVVKELFLGRDDAHRRLAYSVQTERFAHHSASFQVLDETGGKSRLVWTADVLPDAVADYLAGRMEAGLTAAQDVLGRVPA
ncbi:SRPBCC family protein [Phenylobacterium soli]|uniref:SRPBCC family protein n=1 Tax=Phenylobacterium soli TaxID=2170551 RepID=A0A328AJJ9_9CAUL|nr:SRPBCC family protein [Phenylobacterium soli]RAK53048.1 SRPBCC family protein [Phenylobacterium soli]